VGIKHLRRDEAVEICERLVLGRAARLFGSSREQLGRFNDYEGCANLAYHYHREGEGRVLRISYRPDRPPEAVQAELHFVEYLAQGGVRVSRPVRSVRGNLVEVISAGDVPFLAVSFVRGKGTRMPDNGYRYRQGASIEEYFENWGRVLGQLHRLTKTHRPPSDSVRRPQWHAFPEYTGFPFGERLPRVAAKYDQLIAELHALPKNVHSYGLIHNDFNDGNFTVDYETGDITVFDFDDCCYFWFVYDLACAWEGGVGWAMFRPLSERRGFMDRYMAHMMRGYNHENTLSDEWLARLPLFLRLIQMQELMHFAQYLDAPNEETQAGLRYKIYCVENDIPYLGFFDKVYSPDMPFALAG
jgi:Ser/Thr protein kinase RdoA (MazF antagonist)